MPAKEPRSKQATKPPQPRQAASVPAAAENGTYGLPEIRVLARILTQFDLSEVEVEQGGQHIRLRRERAGAAGFAMPAPTFAAPQFAPAPAIAAVAAPEAKPADDGSAIIASPFVGTFYRAPSPEAAPFVEAGQTVKKGQVLCIVEAMKLMNEIEAETTCKIVEILVKNGEPVEYGQALFKVFPQA